MTPGERVRHRLGSVLVALQFGLLLLLAWLALPPLLAGQMAPASWIAGVSGALLALWAVSANRPGNFNIRPQPRSGARLVQQGPYRWIRHPMYTAVMACGWAAAWAGATWMAWLAWLALLMVLVIKAVLEERWMRQAHPGYAAYQQRTRWFLPWVA